MTSAVRSFGLSLPDYPWEAMAPYLARAAEHPGGAVNLSIGTPVDHTPRSGPGGAPAGSGRPRIPHSARHAGTPRGHRRVVRPPPRRSRAGPAACDAHGRFQGTRGVAAVPAWDSSRATSSSVLRLPTPPTTSGRHSREPSRSPLTTSTNWTTKRGSGPAGLGQLAGQPHRKRPRRRIPEERIVDQARELGAVVASDECYAELGWGEWDVQRGGQPVPSILDPRVAGGSHEGLLAVYSLSKQSNLAGYRAAFVAGDPVHHGQPGEQPQARRHDCSLPGPGSHAGGAWATTPTSRRRRTCTAAGGNGSCRHWRRSG